MVVLPSENRINIKGIGGQSKIVGILPKLFVTFGSRVEHCMVGIISGGDFDLLMGNDLNAKFKIRVDIEDRSCTYQHPMLGAQYMRFLG